MNEEFVIIVSDKDMSNSLYAHSLKGKDRDSWQSLEEHSHNVGCLAAEFAKSFASGDWARLLGEMHDLGKARHSFQSYLAHVNGFDDVDYDALEHTHSGAGACLAEKKFGLQGRILAYCIAGHHAGLPDWIAGETPNGALSVRLVEECDTVNEPTVREFIAQHEEKWKLPRPPFICDEKGLAFWIRMLYSSLVDADFLDTEAFMDSERCKARSVYPSLVSLNDAFFRKLDEKQDNALKSEINTIRAEIRSACEAAAESSHTLFSLTVPTGGGKTLSAMAFAFRHAIKWGKKRIIYVIPYTSIIEQTADILRGFLGAENVLEHHSNFDPDKETQQSRLASENWDAPVIVTTTVQFFESLYACKSSRCRKLHNIANSVVILDEVQLLPTNLLKMCAAAIDELTKHYGSTFVLSTATQPVLPWLSDVQEIIPQQLDLYHRLKRTQIEWPRNVSVRKTWREVADELKTFSQVLCIVNRRQDCRELFDLMPQGTIHLSATMCGAHRSLKIAQIKKLLAKGDPIRVISTQLVEAGVDIDFPVVYRAFTGLASISQAAGRCNREGKLGANGRVVVFMPPKESPCGELRNGEYAMMDLLHLPERPSFDSPDIFPLYFSKLYARAHLLGEQFSDWLYKDARKVQLQFREAAVAFKMIKDNTVQIIVRYGGNDKLIEQLHIVGPKRLIMRKLQRYTVTVQRGKMKELLQKGFIEEMHPGVYVQTLPSLYSDDFGLDIFRDGLSPEETMIYKE